MNVFASKSEFFVPLPSQGFAGDVDVYKTLLESTKAIPWKINWSTMAFDYVGPQIEPLLGWAQDSWVSVEDWASRMHPEDRDYAVDFCVSQSMAGVDHEIDYRALTKDNGYVWIRDVVHVVRNAAGEVECLVGFMFDISERKAMEQELLALQKELEALSFEDGLTGISNRRMFDTYLASEWRNARRAAKPLSLIMIDLDYFKQFNDAYGHVAGDNCLKQVAGALRRVGTRPRDVVARFGGEEFALLLPETSAEAALALAEECRKAIADLAIFHANGGPKGHLTASIGVGSVVPAGATGAIGFVESVDRLLYAAKQNGRDQIAALQG